MSQLMGNKNKEVQQLPLEGVRVVDFGQGVAGPYCGMLLADHGATVIKVEPPRGDWGRQMGTAFGDHSSTSISMNRNKQSIVIDFTDPRGLELAHELVAWSNVVVENFRPDVMDRLGLGFDALTVGRSNFVYCSVNGFGPGGPYAAHPAGDSIAQPMGGLMSIIGRADDPPMRVGNVVGDMLAGMNAFQGILLGLRQVENGAGCQRINVSLLESILAFQTPTFTEYLMTGVLPKRVGNDHPLISPSGAYATSDGFVYFTVINYKWEIFCETMGLVLLLSDPRFIDHAGRMAHREALNALVAEVFLPKTTASCLVDLQKVGIPSSRINNYADVMNDPQVVHNEVFRQEPHSTQGSLPVVKSPVILFGEKIPYSHPPGLGEHSRSVLSSYLGYQESKINELVEAGFVHDGNTSNLKKKEIS
jgi:crotonobetainyl-CoA:carnitine CoA-transferase CaiB-like acyl-CoA transferase